MVITALTSIRRGRIGLHLDGEFYCPLHPDAAMALEVGQELTQPELDELLAQSNLLSAKAKALSLLAGRSYTSQGLYQKLAGEFGDDAAQAATERMLELNFLDDEDYARRYAKDLTQRKGLAPARAARELAAKGIDRETAQAVLAEQEEDPELAVARVVKKKYLTALSDEKGLRRTYNALLRLGYRHGDIRTVLEHLQEDETYYDE